MATNGLVIGKVVQVAGPAVTTQPYTPPVALITGRKGLVFVKCLPTPERRLTDCECSELAGKARED